LVQSRRPSGPLEVDKHRANFRWLLKRLFICSEPASSTDSEVALERAREPVFAHAAAQLNVYLFVLPSDIMART
jgi:hypothetical protein